MNEKAKEEKNPMNTQVSETAIYDALKECYDPEVPVDIVDLGLVYGVTIVDHWVGVKMTLTSPGCPASEMISQQVKERLRKLPRVIDADVRIVWQPEWSQDRISEKAKKNLG